MKKILAALTVAVLGLGLVVAAGPAAWAAKPSPTPNHEDYWETLPGEICVKDEAPATPYVITTAAGAGLVYSKLILKAASGDDQNFVISSPALNVGYSHPNGHDNSHIILCTIPVVPQPIAVAGDADPTNAECVVDDDPADGFYTLDQVTGVGYKVFNGATLLQTLESTGDAGSFTFTVDSYPTTLTIKAFALTGFVLGDGATAEWSHTFNAAGEDCNDVKAVAGDPTPTEARCAVPKSEESEVELAATDGFYTIVEAEGVGYYVYVNAVLVDTITSTSPYGPVKFSVTSYPSLVAIQAFALPGYVLDGKQTSFWSHTFRFDEKLCNLQDLALVTPVVDQDPPTCTQSGRFFLGGDGVEWLTSPGGVPVAAGWHNVPSATTLTFQALPAPGNGFDLETQTVFEFEFLASPLECLDTLALTGNEGVPLFLGGAAALLLLGAASIFFTRRRTL